MDNVLERIVRDLIREGYLSRARTLLSLFAGEYPHLELELEAASGNWKAVMRLYETLDEERKKEYQTLYKTAKDRFKENYSEDVIDALQETERNNFEGAIAVLESLSKLYPELVEVVALKLEIARKKKDRERVRTFEETLRKLDPSHPALVKREKIIKATILEYIILVAVLVSVALSLVGLFRPQFDEKKFAALENKIAAIDSRCEDLDQKLTLTFNELGEVKSQLGNLALLQSELQNTQKLLAKSFEDLKGLFEKQNQELLGKVSSFVRATSASTFPSSGLSIDALRSLWLTGYRLYRERKYDDAFNLLSAVLEALKDKDAYFKDDVAYYMALVAYEAKDFDLAKRLFEDFISNFPNSVYVPHAQYFLKTIK
ncbi:tetratricopeptide repeat protein [Pseudothermotoga thermarum]|uniref:Tetratricopeptide TPR_3 repeat-containing protein n=1 Tax=Pseudothermotoga thermarum DSM 5069 TaxID=688269 RepID=F7YTD4_9THEM|nr:tetratricopeptide repeat protein [Pseudothermotoga thermarum]AEH50112.1 Tetratricopeptide TPR_3 repeat-containing protein [Pseudothermotoga thermarum DSM 5069]